MTKNKGGRPDFKPTRLQRQDVQTFKAVGWSQERIARCLGITRPTLVKHFAIELEIGGDQAERMMLRALRRQAMRGNVGAIREMLRRIDVGGAVDRLLEQPEKPARQPPRGKKEIAREKALRAAEDETWGDDLQPLPDRMN